MHKTIYMFSGSKDAPAQGKTRKKYKPMSDLERLLHEMEAIDK